MANIVRDTNMPFPAYFVRGTRSKTELRMFVARTALSWLSFEYARGVRGAVMLDIDDTLIDGRENVAFGFEFMKELYNNLCYRFPIHIVTARPDDDHENVMRMLMKKGFSIPPDRLHMLPTKYYGKSYSHVEDFKFNCYLRILKRHGNVVVRMGDKMWDVSHMDSIRGTNAYLAHVKDRECYIFRDPSMGRCMSCKLPGEK